MSRFPESCVLDASVGIKLFLDEDGSEDVRELFEESLSKSIDSLFVPDLFFIECANILWKKVRLGDCPADIAIGHITDLRDLSLPTTPTSDLMKRALEIACIHGITAYDACYLALAETMDLPLLTADDRLKDAVSGSTHRVIILCQQI